MRWVSRFSADSSGVMLAEYALMLGVFCLGCLCVAHFYSHQLAAAFNRIGDLISLGMGG